MESREALTQFRGATAREVNGLGIIRKALENMYKISIICRIVILAEPVLSWMKLAFA